MGRLIDAANWLRTLVALGQPVDQTSEQISSSPAPAAEQDARGISDDKGPHPCNFNALSGYHLGVGDDIIGFGDTFQIDEDWDPNFANRYFPDK